MHVLVIDPSTEEHEDFGRRLEAAGYERVTFASSHAEGLRRLTDGRDRFDVVLLDIEPSLEIEICRRVRRAARDTPLLVVGRAHGDEFIDDVFATGAEDYVSHPVRWIELLARIQLAVRRRSSEDTLTGLCKRTHFDAALRYEWRGAIRARNATPIAVILADVDQLDVYNMRHGYDHGDRCLQDIGRVLADAVRRDSDLVARHEDDAFAMLIPDASVEAALSIAERARTTIAERGNRPVTVSFGVAADIPRSGVDPLSVVATAEDALRHVKNLGGNRSYTSERSIRKPSSQRFPRTALDTE